MDFDHFYVGYVGSLYIRRAVWADVEPDHLYFENDTASTTP
jgi:hypothetical protein